ncbi:MAG: D-2-hydroxyacid dehydrogenase [Bryobacteraceae bacterium]
MRIVVLDGYCLNPGDLSWNALHAMGDVEVFDRTPEADVVKRAAGATIVLTNKSPFPASAIAALPELKYIGVLATGFNVVDVTAARERGVVVTNVPNYGTHSVAQFTIALLLELCHRVGPHNDAVRTGEWSRNPDWTFWRSPQVELAGKLFGTLGFGRIGRQTAIAAAGLGMKIAAYDANPGEPLEGADFQWLSLDSLIATSDVVSLHCPLLPETTGLMNRERIESMKPSAFLLNTSRGPLIVEQDLADALNRGAIAGAGIDVVAQEPPVDGSPLFGAKNCIVTPHMAWATLEARGRLMDIAVNNVRAFLNGAPVNRVA